MGASPVVLRTARIHRIMTFPGIRAPARWASLLLLVDESLEAFGTSFERIDENKR